MVGRRCSEPAHGYFLPSLDYFLYEAELAAPLYEGSYPPSATSPPSSSLVRINEESLWGSGAVLLGVLHVVFVCFQLNTGLLPKCEQYYRQQGYDFKFVNGRVVLVRRSRRSLRQRRQVG